VPRAGQNRLRAMIETRPDWVLSRQRAWGVPIAVFVDKATANPADAEVMGRIVEAFEKEGADAWFAEAPPSASSATSTIPPTSSRSRHPRRLVRLRLDACLRARRPPRPEVAGRSLSRRLRPASRLVPFLAARSCGTARPRALSTAC
jgi:hypothetical protein